VQGEIVFVVAALFAAAPTRAYFEQRAQIRDLQREAAILDRANARLSQRIAALHDPSYLERLSRECLGMVRRGEGGFVLVPRGGAPPPPC
jgi:cell division protein FtsB